MTKKSRSKVKQFLAGVSKVDAQNMATSGPTPKSSAGRQSPLSPDSNSESAYPTRLYPERAYPNRREYPLGRTYAEAGRLGGERAYSTRAYATGRSYPAVRAYPEFKKGRPELPKRRSNKTETDS
jgi:hypothetical protein